MKPSIAVIIVIVGLLGSIFGQSSTPKTAEEFFTEGLALLRSKSFEASLASFEKSAALNPRQSATFLNIGSVSMILRRYEKAENAFRTAINLDPTNAVYHSEICHALSVQHKDPEALNECEEGVRLGPDLERTHIARINAMRSARKSPEAIQILADQLAARFRNSENALVTAADVSISNRNFSYAVSILESLISLNPDVAMYHGLLAEAYLRLAKDSESLASARTALKLDPESPYGNYAMGLIFFELGQNEEAAVSLSKVTSEDPHFRFAKFYHAGSESRRGRHSEAVRILNELVPVDASEVEFSFRLGE